MIQSDRVSRILQPFRHGGHRKPVTRREFLSQGFLSGVAMVTMPSVAALDAAGSESDVAWVSDIT